MKPIFKYILFLIIFAILGFSREFLFVNLNKILYKLYYHNNDIIIPDSLGFLLNYNYIQLYYIKYPLTIIFYLLYFFVSLFFVKTIYSNKKITVWIVYIYGLIFLLSSLTMAYNYIINKQFSGEEYTFSRWIMGIAQSPLVAFFTIAAAKLYEKNYSKKI